VAKHVASGARRRARDVRTTSPPVPASVYCGPPTNIPAKCHLATSTSRLRSFPSGPPRSRPGGSRPAASPR